MENIIENPMANLFHSGRRDASRRVDTILKRLKSIERIDSVTKNELTLMGNLCELVYKADKILKQLSDQTVA